MRSFTNLSWPTFSSSRSESGSSIESNQAGSASPKSQSLLGLKPRDKSNRESGIPMQEGDSWSLMLKQDNLSTDTQSKGSIGERQASLEGNKFSPGNKATNQAKQQEELAKPHTRKMTRLRKKISGFFKNTNLPSGTSTDTATAINGSKRPSLDGRASSNSTNTNATQRTSPIQSTFSALPFLPSPTPFLSDDNAIATFFYTETSESPTLSLPLSHERSTKSIFQDQDPDTRHAKSKIGAILSSFPSPPENRIFFSAATMSNETTEIAKPAGIKDLSTAREKSDSNISWAAIMKKISNDFAQEVKSARGELLLQSVKVNQPSFQVSNVVTQAISVPVELGIVERGRSIKRGKLGPSLFFGQ